MANGAQSTPGAERLSKMDPITRGEGAPRGRLRSAIAGGRGGFRRKCGSPPARRLSAAVLGFLPGNLAAWVCRGSFADCRLRTAVRGDVSQLDWVTRHQLRTCGLALGGRKEKCHCPRRASAPVGRGRAWSCVRCRKGPAFLGLKLWGTATFPLISGGFGGSQGGCAALRYPYRPGKKKRWHAHPATPSSRHHQPSFQKL